MYGPTGGGKKFATKFDFLFPAEYYTRPVAPLTPDFNVGISKLEIISFFAGGDVRQEKSSQSKNTKRFSNIEIWGSGDISSRRGVCFNIINGVRPRAQSRRLRTFFLLLSGGLVYIRFPIIEKA